MADPSVNHEKSAIGGIRDDAILNCLIGYPEGTLGYQEEQYLLRVLNALCKSHGYGRVRQFATWIEELWRDPSIAESKEAANRERRQTIAPMAKAVAAEKAGA